MKKILLLFALIFVLFGCKKDDTTEPTNTDCATQLETSKRCKAVLPPCDGEQLPSSIKCLAKTNSGVRCQNNTLNKCGYCSQVPTHKDQWDGICPNETKNACGYCEDHKDQYQGK
ncbi:MAG: hypothetical protein FWG85_00345 [Bacteroidetes bacterium]|nr:hypothetical protein [Bacteroidota bacterium]